MLLATLLAATMASPLTSTPVTIIAHRGLTEGAPENTLAAFRQSITAGIKIIELDLRTTSDGQLVVLHDATLDRTTDCSGAVADLTLTMIKACDAGGPAHRGERVPTLGEAVGLVGDTRVRLLLDCKSAPVDAVLREIRTHHAADRVILGLRSVSDIARARAALPDITMIAFMPGARDAPAFFKAGANIVRLWSDWVEADPELVARTAIPGRQVWIMVGRHLPSRPEEWRALHGRMIAAGAQGLITDRPDLISAP